LVQPAAFETRCCEFRSGRFAKIVNKKFTSTRTSAGSSSIFAPPGVTCQLIFVEITAHVEGEFRNLRSWNKHGCRNFWYERHVRTTWRRSASSQSGHWISTQIVALMPGTIPKNNEKII
jgi:hypothetical protein